MAAVPEVKVPVEVPGVLSPFSSPQHAAELEIESPGGFRHRARIEGQDGQQCLDRVLNMLYRCCETDLAHCLATPSVRR